MRKINLETYAGPAIEKGGTAMKISQPAPGLVWLVDSGYWGSPATVLDYGAGHGRNSNYLREMGVQVYSYDPFNGTHVDGWTGVSNRLPNQNFDLAFTSFVLNVVPKSEEETIIETIQSYCDLSFHITRNMDIAEMAVNALSKKDKLVWKFWQENFLASRELPEDTIPTKELIIEFCEFGFQTSKGFQRIPMLEMDYGYSLIKRVGSYKVYQI